MTRDSAMDKVSLTVRDTAWLIGVMLAAGGVVVGFQLAVLQRLSVVETKVDSLQQMARQAARVAAAAGVVVGVAGCSSTRGFMGTGIGATPIPEPQPAGFESVHWVAYAGGFLMVAIGAALFWLLDRPKAGAGMAVTGLCTLALALAAAHYGQELALASFVLLGCGIVGALGYMGWYAWTKRAQLREVVTKANGHLEGLSLTRPTARAVAKIKGNA